MLDRVKSFIVIQCNHDHVLIRGEELDDVMQLLLTQSAGMQIGHKNPKSVMGCLETGR